VLNKILIWYVNILKDITVKRLKRDNITDTKIVYFKNKDFQEEVLIDNNMNPHYSITYFNAINIDANLFQPSSFEMNQHKIDEIDSKLTGLTELTELKTKDIPFGISVKIKRAKR
jgi:hypothetical protein